MKKAGLIWICVLCSVLFAACGKAHKSVDDSEIDEVLTIVRLPETEVKIGDKIYFADQNVIYCMNSDETDVQKYFIAHDVINEMKGTGNVLYYTTANATMRLVLDSKASEFVVEHHNLPVHLEVVGEDDIRLTCEENAVNGDAITNLYHVNRRTQSLFDLSEDEILCSYHYGGAVYFLYTDADGVMRVGYSNDNQTIHQIVSGESLIRPIIASKKSENGRFSWEDYQYDMSGNDTYCYIKSSDGSIYYADYRNYELQPLLLELDVAQMKVIDCNTLLLRTRGDRITYVTYLPEEGTLTETWIIPEEYADVFERPELVAWRDSCHETYDTVAYVARGAKCEMDGYLYYADSNILHRMSLDDGKDDPLEQYPDVIYQIIPCRGNLMIVTETKLYKYSTENGSLGPSISLPEEPHGIELHDDTVYMYAEEFYCPSYWEGFRYRQGEIYLTTMAVEQDIKQVVPEEEIPEYAIWEGYECAGKKYYLWIELIDERGYVSVGYKTENGDYRRISVTKSEYVKHWLEECQKGNPLEVACEGNDTYAYWFLDGWVMYFSDYSTDELKLYMENRLLLAFKVFDRDHLLVKYATGQTVYVEIVPKTHEEDGRVFETVYWLEREPQTEEMRHFFDDVSGPPLTHFEVDGKEISFADVLPEGEQVYQVSPNHDWTKLFLCTERYLYRYDVINGTCVQLKGGLPNLSYWIDVLDDDTVILTHFFYYGPTDEGFLTFEAGELMRFKD